MKPTRAGLFAAVLLVSTFGTAATFTKLNESVLAPLRRAVIPGRTSLNVPLNSGQTATVDLQEFRVWTEDAQILIHERGRVTHQSAPRNRYFRGAVEGDDESFAFFSVDPSGRVDGLLETSNQRFAFGSQRRGGVLPRARDVGESSGAFDDFLASADYMDDLSVDRRWECDVDSDSRQPFVVSSEVIRKPAPALAGTQQYAMTLEVETDGELYALAGSSANVTTLVSNLTGALATIYVRDLHTNVFLKALHIYPDAATDPWVATDASSGLAELGDYYHSVSKPSGRTTTAVVMLSGKATNSGIAWKGVVGISDINQGDWAGPYAWCGSIDYGNGTAPDPDATNNGVQYGMPVSAYWPLAELSHELGHNMGGPHTHCVPLTTAEALAAGRGFVDICASGGTGCYGGPTFSAPPELGTIMSYCHNIFSATPPFYPQSRFIFGKASEVSHHMLDDYLLHVGGPLSGGGSSNIVACATATLGAVAAPVSVLANSIGNLASVISTPGQTYEWTITGGTITAGASSSAATFTAGASGNVVLRVATYGSNKCGITDTKTIPIIAGTPARGDVNGSGSIDAADIVFLANFLFAGGPAPIGSADVDNDGAVNAKDLFYLVNYVFADGAAPAP